MKIKLTVEAEFEPNPKHYEDTAPGMILQTEQLNLADMGVAYYLDIFKDDEIKSTLVITEL